MRTIVIALPLLLLLLLSTSCASTPEPHAGPPREIPGALRSTSDIPGAFFLWREQIAGGMARARRASTSSTS